MRRVNGWTMTALGATMMLAACGGGSDGSGATGSTPARTIAKTMLENGDDQTALVATAPVESLKVIVKENGVPLAGATVNWAASGAGASVVPASNQTDDAGISAAQWILGTKAGVQTASASLAGAAGSPVTFHATATPGTPATITKVTGDGQTGIIRGSFPDQVVVLITDRFNNPLTGVRVNFSPVGGVTAVNTAVLTDRDGKAATPVIGAAIPGAGGVTASVGGIPDPATFTLTTANAVREVTVGPGITFASVFNESVNPAVDTISAGQGVLWRWAGGTHSVQSVGTPIFRNSVVSSTVGNLHTVTFNTAGTYQYECAVHGAEMSGRVVVQ